MYLFEFNTEQVRKEIIHHILNLNSVKKEIRKQKLEKLNKLNVTTTL